MLEGAGNPKRPPEGTYDGLRPTQRAYRNGTVTPEIRGAVQTADIPMARRLQHDLLRRAEGENALRAGSKFTRRDCAVAQRQLADLGQSSGFVSSSPTQCDVAQEMDDNKAAFSPARVSAVRMGKPGLVR